MRLLHACWSVPLAVAATFSPAGKISLAEANPEPVKRGVAYFEPPRH